MSCRQPCTLGGLPFEKVGMLGGNANQSGCGLSFFNPLKVNLHTSQVANEVGAYPGFCSMKRQGVFLLPTRWDASLSQGYPQHYIRWYPFLHLGGDGHCESKVSCQRTQYNVRRQGSNPDHLIPWRVHYLWGHHASHNWLKQAQLAATVTERSPG